MILSSPPISQVVLWEKKCYFKVALVLLQFLPPPTLIIFYTIVFSSTAKKF